MVARGKRCALVWLLVVCCAAGMPGLAEATMTEAPSAPPVAVLSPTRRPAAPPPLISQMPTGEGEEEFATQPPFSGPFAPAPLVPPIQAETQPPATARPFATSAPDQAATPRPFGVIPRVTEAPVRMPEETATPRPFGANASVTEAPVQTAAATPAPAFENLNAFVAGPTRATLRWQGPPDAEYVVELKVNGQFERTAVEEGALSTELTALVPGAIYEVRVLRLPGQEALQTYIRTPKAGRFADHGYRWIMCNAYLTDETAEDAFENRKRLETIAAAALQALPETSGLAFGVRFNWRATDANKEVTAMLVLRTPEGYVFSDAWADTFDGTWTDTQYMPDFTYLMDEYRMFAGAWAKGAYRLELYLNEQLAGEGTFTVE